MIAIDVYLNGKFLGRAGAEDLSVLDGIVSAVGKLGPHSKGAKGNEDTYYLELRVGGMTGRQSVEEDEHLDWVTMDLEVGNEICFRLVEANTADVPKSTRPVYRENEQEKYFKWAKEFYLAYKDKYEG
jgi:hypothetical protein